MQIRALIAIVACSILAGCGQQDDPSQVVNPAPTSTADDDSTVASSPDAAIGFEIGMRAPEIEAEDLDGVQFKLSDYRGKVVVLDFWGNW